jgi:two-component sensor histidine kinase
VQTSKGETVEQPITIERTEAGVYAFIAVNGDVQIGWCRKAHDGWCVEDTDNKRIGGPFKTLKDAKEAGFQLLRHLAGESNPGH